MTTLNADDSRCRVCGLPNGSRGPACVGCAKEPPAIAPRRGFDIPTPRATDRGGQPDSPAPQDTSAGRRPPGATVSLARATGVLFWAALLLAALVFLALVVDPTLPVFAIVLTGWLLLRRLTRKKPRPADGRLPSYPSSGQVIGGFLASLEQVVTGQQAAVAQIVEQYHEPWDSVGDVTVLGLDEPIERLKPPDRSRARL